MREHSLRAAEEEQPRLEVEHVDERNEQKVERGGRLRGNAPSELKNTTKQRD